ncbi:MAG TPA: hypothetical protein VFM30_05860 [Steroidobacteraceae bacterium]|jgi:hypothetical protein|nr:hypothetical protein [Steroidobacteraceae bacterium]
MHRAWLLIALLVAAPLSAQEYQPYPQPKVTIEQWQAYLNSVREYLEPTAEIYKDKHIVAFQNPDTRTFYIFTTKDHPAHPAWVTRQLVEQDGQVKVRQIGYYAGNEQAFDKLFREYLQRNEELMKEVAKRNR